MAGGAVIAAAAGARRRRLAAVVQAFRAAGATAPDRALPLDEMLTGHAGEISRLANVGVLVTGPGDERWYLDEAAYASWQEAHRRARLRRVSTVLVPALLLILLALWMTVRCR